MVTSDTKSAIQVVESIPNKEARTSFPKNDICTESLLYINYTIACTGEEYGSFSGRCWFGWNKIFQPDCIQTFSRDGPLRPASNGVFPSENIAQECQNINKFIIINKFIN